MNRGAAILFSEKEKALARKILQMLSQECLSIGEVASIFNCAKSLIAKAQFTGQFLKCPQSDQQ